VKLLEWLGLERNEGYPNLDKLVAELRRALPHDEAVIIRYLAVVIALLGQVAYADGRLTPAEETTVRRLLEHTGRLAPAAVDAVCTALRTDLGDMRDEERERCYREIRSLCDARERVQVMRLLIGVAAADGALSPQEEAEIHAIASELAVPPDEVEALTDEVDERRGG
jgi:DnaJ like chaperone protein